MIDTKKKRRQLEPGSGDRTTGDCTDSVLCMKVFLGVHSLQEALADICTNFLQPALQTSTTTTTTTTTHHHRGDLSGQGCPRSEAMLMREMVASGQVRALDKVGNDQADDAADHGRRRVTGSVIDARRHLGCVWSLVFCCSQFASVLHCHREGCS